VYFRLSLTYAQLENRTQMIYIPASCNGATYQSLRMKKTASLHTLGCRLNQAETAIIARTLKESGYSIVDWGKPSDLTIINTCTVTEQADAKCRQAVRQAVRRNPDSFVAVVGCYPQIALDVISKIEGVDLIVGNEKKLRLIDYIDSLEKKTEPKIVHSVDIPHDEFTIDSVGEYDNHTRANLKIQDGCDFICSFCVIPRARGRARSRKFDDVLKEARKLIELGNRELVLTGVNIGTYKSGGSTFIDLLGELEALDGLDRLRISSIEPTTIGREVVEMISESDTICRHLHIPLQSGDDDILEAMCRRHRAEEFADFVEWTVDKIPGIGIGTDVMVGFPGETDEHFKHTRKLLADLPLQYFHVFIYSDRKGTPASRMKNKVDYRIKKERSKIMIELGGRKRHAFCERYIGTAIEVLFETEHDGLWTGFTDNYIRVQANGHGNDLHNTIRTVIPERIDDDTLTGKIQ